ncbi:unnamed protein product [Ixodes pacificus]
MLYLIITVCFVCSTRSVTCNVPLARTHTGLVAGSRILVGGKEVDAFLGIPFAKPPVGDLRFRNPLPAEPWKGTINATSKPTPCWQLNLRFLGERFLNYSSASEDCLYLNVWRPASACQNVDSCLRKHPVVVFIHGGAFQWGDSALFIYDPANFVALSNVVFVTFNYRLSIFGFLSLEKPERLGNMGLWDQNLVLKWVQRNIEHFGGDPNEVTLSGQSAGAISVGLHAVAPPSQGLFKRVIMESGTPLSMILGMSYRGVNKFTHIAGALGCYDTRLSFNEQLDKVMACLRKLDARFIIKILASVNDVQRMFSPIHGDDFLPQHVLSEKTWKSLSFKNVLIGTNRDEGSLFLDHLKFTFPRLEQVMSGDYRLAITFALAPVFDIPVSKVKHLVNFYFGGYETKHDTKAVVDIFGKIFGDAVFDCPTQLFAETIARQGISTYRYIFAHESTFSFWPDWMGVVHAEELVYTLGSLPFYKDSDRYTEPLGDYEKEQLAKIQYTTEEQAFMEEIVNAWGSFISAGKPSIPLPGFDWPLYTTESPQLLYLRPSNYTKGYFPRRKTCELWRPFLFRR